MAFVKNKPVAGDGADERLQQRDFAGLVHQLDDADCVARRWAARDLCQHTQASAALVARLSQEQDTTVREIILTSLTRLGDQPAVAGLVECLRSEDVQLRNEAIEAMKALPQAVAPIMGGLLRDADADVRILALNVLESLRHPLVEQWLIEVIQRDQQINVCGVALDLLCELATDAALPALLELKRRFADEPYIQFATAVALKRIAKA